MRVHTKESTAFKPVTLEIVFESREELAEFYSIFNYIHIASSLIFIDSDKICESLGVKTYLKVGSGFYKRLIYAMNHI